MPSGLKPFSPISEINGIKQKQCSCCKSLKQIGEFYIDRGLKSGYRAACKDCVKEWQKKYLPHRREYERIIYHRNLKATREKAREYYKKNKDKIKEYPSYGKRYGNRNKDGLKRWILKNREKLNYNRRIDRKKPTLHLKDMVSLRIRKSLKNGKQGIKLNEIFTWLGYSISDLKIHLEKQFKEGMNWKNYGFNGWHIHHKIPVNQFNCQNIYDGDFKICWGLNNLQPLWMEEHLKKGGMHYRRKIVNT